MKRIWNRIDFRNRLRCLQSEEQAEKFLVSVSFRTIFIADNCEIWPNAINDVSSIKHKNDKGVKSNRICCVSDNITRKFSLERDLLARESQKADQ